LFFRGVFRATLITLCFIKLDFVVGHGTAVQLGCTTIRLWYKEAHQYSRTHPLVLSELSVGVHKTVNRIGRTCISLL